MSVYEVEGSEVQLWWNVGSRGLVAFDEKSL